MFGDARPDTVRHWLTEKGADNIAIAYRSKFGAKKRLFKEQELVVSQKKKILPFRNVYQVPLCPQLSQNIRIACILVFNPNVPYINTSYIF